MMSQTYEWITKPFLQNVLQQYLEDQVNVVNFSTSPAIPVGENYTSDLIKITVTFEDSKQQKVISIITKCCPNDELLKNYADDLKLFVQEIGFYTEIVPAMINFGDVKISANSIYASEEKYIIMLEDLTNLGFRMYPREIGLDLKHSLLVVKKMAYLHASSVAIFKKNPQLVTKYNLGIYWNNPFTVRWITTGIKALVEVCAEFSYLNKYENKLKFIQNQILEIGFESSKPTGKLNVLNHGDAWTNNFMFSYNDENEVQDMMFIDFQVILFSSPCLDLNYFWATSPNPTVLHHHLNTVLDYYYAEFLQVLQKLHVNIDLPDGKQFKEEFKTKAIYGLIALVTVSPLVTASRRVDASFDQFFNNNSKDGFRYHCFTNERYMQKLIHLLDLYENFGTLR